ncbi:hypothetical protein V8C86DRAFT_2817289 [Haematococcus lacustris]
MKELATCADRRRSTQWSLILKPLLKLARRSTSSVCCGNSCCTRMWSLTRCLKKPSNRHLKASAKFSESTCCRAVVLGCCGESKRRGKRELPTRRSKWPRGKWRAWSPLTPRWPTPYSRRHVGPSPVHSGPRNRQPQVRPLLGGTRTTASLFDKRTRRMSDVTLISTTARKATPTAMLRPIRQMKFHLPSAPARTKRLTARQLTKCVLGLMLLKIWPLTCKKMLPSPSPSSSLTPNPA